MNAYELLKELEKQNKEIDVNTPIEKLDEFISFIKSIKIEEIQFSSKQEIDLLLSEIDRIIKKVVFLKGDILKEADQLSKKRQASTTYIRNENLDNR